MKPVKIHRPLGDNPPHADLYYGTNALDALKLIPDESIQCCVTSPPYWGLRSYPGTPPVWGCAPECEHVWGSDLRCQKCGAWQGHLGLETTPESYIEHLVQVFREFHRVLRSDGTLWVNLGDSYARQGGDASSTPRHWDGRDPGKGRVDTIQKVRRSSKNKDYGDIKPKDLVGIPWMAAFALRADGWYLRQDIVWHKPNPMPEPVQDRPTRSHEHIFLLTKSSSYHYDTDAIREPCTMKPQRRMKQRNSERDHAMRPDKKYLYQLRDTPGVEGNPIGRNKRDVWTIATKPYKGAHFAVMPEKLAETCLKAGGRKGQTVLDPFSGSATTGAVAMRLGMNYVGLDLSEEYLPLAQARLQGNAPPDNNDNEEGGGGGGILDLFGTKNTDPA